MASTYALIVVITYIPLLLVEVLLFIRFLDRLKLYPQSYTKRLSPFQKHAHIICLCGILITSICDIVHAFGGYITNTALLFPRIIWIRIFYISADVAYYISTLTLYILLIERLYSTFVDTIYRLSKCALCTLSVIMVIQSFFMCCYCVHLVVRPCTKPLWCHWSGLIAFIITVIDYILNIVLFALFIHKLRQLIFAQLSPHDSSVRFSIDEINNALDDRSNSQLLDVISKQIIIGIAVTLCNQGFGTCVFITEGWTDKAASSEDLMVDYIVRAMEGMVIAFLLYLGLGVNDAEYMKVCGRCHQMCYSYGAVRTRKSVMVRQERDYYVAMKDDNSDSSSVAMTKSKKKIIRFGRSNGGFE